MYGQEKAQFPPIVWTVLVGTLVIRAAFVMIWPFLALILEREFGLTPTAVGSILSVAFLSSAVAGLWSGYFSDRFGRLPMMIAGAATAAAAYGVLAMATSVASYATGAFIVGLSRAILDPPSKALIADSIEHQPTRDLAFHARYFLINLGAAIGPLVALVFGLAARQQTFWITALVHVGFGAAILVAARLAPVTASARGTSATTMVHTLAILRRDKAFGLLLLAMVLMMFGYAQQEATLVQYVTIDGGALTVALVSALIVTNAATVVLFQFPLLRALAGVDPFVRTYVGLALFGAAFVAYPLLPLTGLLPWIAVTWVLSVGEAILFPTLQIQVDRLAPADMKGSYFGAAGLSSLGFGLGPLAGGLMLQHAGGVATFWSTALAIAVAGLCCHAASRVRVTPPEPVDIRAVRTRP